MNLGLLGRKVARRTAAMAGREELYQRLLAALSVAERRGDRDALATRSILAACLRPDSIAVDVGANVGSVLEQTVHLAPNGRHVAFEPLPHLAAQLRQRFPSVEVHHAAASTRSGQMTFHHVVNNAAFSNLGTRAEIPADSRVETISIPVMSLDETLEGMARIDLIKIDVEGHELEVLRGAERTLREHRPVVLFEHGKGAAQPGTSGAIWDTVDAARLRIFDLEGNGPFMRAEFEALFTQPVWDFLAVPA